MLYVATDRLSWLVIGAVMFLPPAVFAATQMSHLRTRLTCWLDPMSNANFSTCGQINAGLFGLANGGITGAGLGESRPNVVPHAESDRSEEHTSELQSRGDLVFRLLLE